MATNPRIPNQNEPNRRGPMLVPKPERPTSAVPGVALAIITALLLLGAIFYFMPRAPKDVSTAPGQVADGQLQISGIRMSPAPTDNAVNLDGQLTNSGSTDVNGVMAEVDFPLGNGQVGSVQAPVLGIAIGRLANNGKQADTGKVTGDTEDLTKAPIKPGETRPVRITVDQVPSGWNHQMPEVRVATTTGTTVR